MKKMICVAFCILVCCLMLLPLSVPVKAETLTDGIFTYELKNGQVTITRCDPDVTGVVTVPKDIGGFPVVGIGDSAFCACNQLTEVVISEGITEIAPWAFICCENLKTVRIPSSVSNLGSATFLKCNSLTSIDVSDHPYFSNDERGVLFNKNKTVLIHAPNGLAGTYNIPDTVTEIYGSAFYTCEKLSAVVMPDHVTDIGSGAFMGCYSLETVDFSKNLKKIPGNAFYGCGRLRTVVIPETVTAIGHSAFRNCSSLTTVILHQGIEEIEQAAFEGCTSLKGNIYQGCRYLGIDGNDYFALINAVDTQRVTYSIPNVTTLIAGGAFINCDRLVSITIPENVVSIGDDTFRDCDNLSTINFGENITKINEDTFYNCKSLKDIIIPASVETIEDYAFSTCDGLEKVYFYGAAPEIRYHAFDKCSPTFVYHKGMDGWDEAVNDINGFKASWEEVEHFITNYISDQNYTCTADGTESGVCQVCGETDTRTEVGSAAHTMVYTANADATCTMDGTKTGKCSRCSKAEIIPDPGTALGHSFTNYVSDNNYTCMNDGTKTARCDRCGIKDTIPDVGSAAHVFSGGSCVICGLVVTDGTLDISLKSFGNPDDTILIRLKSETEGNHRATGTGEHFMISGITPGSYTLTITKKNHVEYCCDVNIRPDMNKLQLQINLLGDANGDGKVNMGDVAQTFGYVRGAGQLSDYAIECVDTNDDGKVNMGDIARIFSHARGGKSLWYD